MITDALLKVFSAAFRSLLNLIPEWAVPDFDLARAGEMFGRAGALFNEYVPLPLMVACLLALVALHIAHGMWQGVLFVYHQFWGSS